MSGADFRICEPCGLSGLPGLLAFSIPGWGEHRADELLPLASVGKLLLLASVAKGFAAGSLDPDERWPYSTRTTARAPACSSSSRRAEWPFLDLARLTAAVSDNTATNALLRRVGLDRVCADAAALGLQPDPHARLASASPASQAPADLRRRHAPRAGLLAAAVAEDRNWGPLMLEWLAGCLDRSMVPAAIPHDPEDSTVREVPVADLWVANKTGTDVGTRCDVGIVRGARQICYAVLTSCAAGREFEMMLGMREIGALVGRLAASAPTDA